MPTQIRLLVLQPSEEQYAILLHLLRTEELEPSAVRAADIPTLTAELKQARFDAILLSPASIRVSVLDALIAVRKISAVKPAAILIPEAAEDESALWYDNGADAIFNPKHTRELASFLRRKIFLSLHERSMLENLLHERYEKSCDLYRDILEHTNDLVWETDATGRCVYINEYVNRILGYDRDELIGKNFGEIIPAEEREQALASFRDSIENRTSIRNWILKTVRRDGSEIVLETSCVPFFDANGNALGIHGASRDVTASVKNQEEHILLTEIVESTSDCIAIASFDGRIVYINKAGKKLLAIDNSIPVNRLLIKDIHPADAFEIVLNEGIPAAVQKEVWSGTSKIVTHEGREIPVSQVIIGHSRNDGVIQYFSTIIRDIRPLIKAEEETLKLLQRERELGELKSKFISLASHEFRTPLTAILGSEEMLEHYGDHLDGVKKNRHLLRIKSAVMRMTELLDDVVVFGKVESGKLEFCPAKVDMSELCSAIAREANAGRDQRRQIRLTLPTTASLLKADEKMMRIALSKILANAIKYSSQEAPILLEITGHPAALTIAVRDEGVGIPQEDIPHVFTAFYRGENVKTLPGAGLGLSIAKRIIEMHNGTIDVTSELNWGTKITITLPIVKENS